MSVTDVKAKAPKKASSKKITKAQEAALKIALEAAAVEYVPLSDLVKSPLNVRSIPYSVDSVRGLADSIETLGLLQNLIVHTLADGQSGVAAGGRRLTALNLLAQEDRLAADHTVMVKRVSDDIAALASIAENEQRAAMHPAEQIAGFRTLAEQGKTPAQIGDALGFGSRHVQRMLKLANLAPSLMDKLAQDELTVEQCQALCLEDDPARQVEVFESVKASWSNAPAHLIKRAITETEMRTDNTKFRFIGREAYEAAGGYVREDLFSQDEGDGTADSVLVFILLGMALMGCTFGPMAALLPELFPTEVRYSGASMAYNLSSIVGASLPTLIAIDLNKSYGLGGVGLYLAANGLFTLAALWTSRETSQIDLADVGR